MSYICEKDLIHIINDVLIIDVRGTDFKGGNIINGINMSYEKFNITDFEKIYDENNKKYIVIHCMYSSIRGPRIYKLIIDFLESSPDASIKKKLEKTVHSEGPYPFIKTV